MKNDIRSLKAYKLYSLLNSKEKAKFNAWLQADLGTRQPELIKLASFFEAGMNKQDAWGKLFPQRPFKDNEFRTYSKRLNTYLEEFLAFISFRKDIHTRNLHLLDEVKQRGNPDILIQTLKKAEKTLESQQVRDENYYYHRYLLNLIRHEYTTQHQKTGWEEDARAANTTFDFWWILAKLKLAQMNISYEKRSVKIPTTFISAIDEELTSDSSFAKAPEIRIYYLAYKIELRQDQSKLDFKAPMELWELLQEQASLLSASTYRVIYSILLNFYIRQTNNNKTAELYTTLVDLYVYGFENRILETHNYLSIPHFNNLITIITSEHFRQPAKARVFVQEYGKLLPPAQRESVILFNEAIIMYSEKKFKNVVTLIQQRSGGFGADLMEIRARILVLRSRYELNGELEESEIKNLIRALKTKIRISVQIREAFKAFLRFFQRLIKAYSKEDYLKLKIDIQKAKKVPHQEWLIEKIMAKIP